MNRLHGRTAFITGASSGIGRSIARAFAGEGARLILSARRIDRVEALAGSFAPRTARRPPAARWTCATVPRSSAPSRPPPEWAGIDILVNNAGLSRGLDRIHEASIEDWDEMIDTNVKGLLYVSRAVIPGLVERGRGHVVNIGSIAGRDLYPGGSVYCASKFAERAITKGTMIDLNGTNVRVTTIDPGLVETEFSIVRFHGDAERASKVYEGIDPITPDDVADAVLYAVTRPPNMNIAEMVILAGRQAGATFVSRKPASGT